MSDNTHLFRQLSLAVSSVGVVAWVLWGILTKRYWLFVITVVSWLSHVIVFYAIVVWRYDHGEQTITPFFTEWSSIIRLHAVILSAACGVILAACAIIERRRK